MFEFVAVVSIAVVVVGVFAFSAYQKACNAETKLREANSQITWLIQRANWVEFEVMHRSERENQRQSVSQVRSNPVPQTQNEPAGHNDDELVAHQTEQLIYEREPTACERSNEFQDEMVFESVRHHDISDELAAQPDNEDLGNGEESLQTVGNNDSQSAMLNDSDLHHVDVQSIEMKLGTYWFVRIGVILLLTGLAFLAYYKKQFFIDTPPGVKVTSFYFLCFAMSGVGHWLSKANEKLKNFGHVLIAGGFAGVYFTIYASHLFEPIQVIESVNVVVGLLAAWGVFLVWISDRLKSETMAVFTIGATYYATYIPLIHTGDIPQWLLLSSNLILAVTSIGFMLKNRWLRLPQISLVVTYTGFAITQFGWHIVSMPTLILFVSSVWLVYTLALFLSRSESFGQLSRLRFANLNNAAMFGLISFAVFSNVPALFWLASGTIGGILLLLSLAVNRSLAQYPQLSKCYVIHGLVLTNLGIMTFHMSGALLGPILAAEGILLAVLTVRLGSRITRFACVTLSGIAVICASIDVVYQTQHFIAGGLVVAVLLLISTCIFDRIESTVTRLIRLQTGLLAGFSLMIGTFCILFASGTLSQLNSQFDWTPVWLLAVPVVLAIFNYRSKIREVAILSQFSGVIGIGTALTLAARLESLSLPLSIAGLLTLILIHLWFWQRQFFLACCKDISSANYVPRTLEAVYSAGLVAQGLAIFIALFGFGSEWIWIGSIVAVVVVFYSVSTRAFLLGLFSQSFLIAAAVKLITSCWIEESLNAANALLPIAAIVLINLLIAVWFWRLTEMTKLRPVVLERIQAGYRIAAAVTSLAWIQRFVPAEWLVLIYASIGVAVFVAHVIRKNNDLRWISIGYSAIGLIAILSQFANGESYWQSGVAILLVIVFQQIARRNERWVTMTQGVQNGIILGCGLLTAIWVTLKSSEIPVDEVNGIRTLVWTGLGVVFFGLGLGLRERYYRLIGLITLAIALISILPSIWNMSTEIKIASVFVMGGVFVALGYVYSRFKDSLKNWL